MQGRLLACGRAGRLATALPPPAPLPPNGSAAVIAAEFVPATAGSAYRLEPKVATTTSSPLPPAKAHAFRVEGFLIRECATHTAWSPV